MPKKLFKAGAIVPDIPRARYMRRAPKDAAVPFIDVTKQVAHLEIEALDGERGAHALIRLDTQGAEVWRTIHLSLDEARWQAQHEYDVEEENWSAC